ncbi:MAG TPA: hypothetical protein VGC72_15390 [Candidatus Elarobacter sp.]
MANRDNDRDVFGIRQLPQPFRHVDDAIAAAPVRVDPWEHIVAERVFAPDVYASIEEKFPRGAMYQRHPKVDETQFFGADHLRLEALLPRDAELLGAEQRALWVPIAEHLRSADFISGLIARFRPRLVARFGADLDAPDFVERRLDAKFMFVLHEPGYSLGVHTDMPWKVLTAVFYVPERGDTNALGTALYVPRDPGFACNGSRHYDPAGFQHVATVPYRPNTAFIFARGDRTFHGVEPCTAEALGGSFRPGFHLNVNERPPAGP